MNCFNCGHLNDSNSNFCVKCGKPLVSSSANNVYNNNLPNGQSSEVVYGGSDKNSNKSKKIFWILIIVFISLFIGWAFSLGNDENDDKNEVVEKEDGPVVFDALVGNWYLNLDEQLDMNNYFIFNSDLTFSWKAGDYVLTGTYTAEFGLLKNDGTKAYFDNELYWYYDVILTPTLLTNSDGTTQTDGLSKSEFAIAVKGDNMKAQNLMTYSYFTLKRQ